MHGANSMVFLVLLLAAGVAQAAKLPHIMLFVQDDLGWADTGAMLGQSWPAARYTQNITQMAANSLRLTNMHSHWHCSPTRRSILSGRTPIHHGEQLSGIATDDVDLRQMILPQKLARAGYRSYAVGKAHTGFKSTRQLYTRRGFSRYVGYLGGSQSYYSNDRWEGDDNASHPLHQDSQFTHPPAGCGNQTDVSPWGPSVAGSAAAAPQGCGAGNVMHDTKLPCQASEPRFTKATSAEDCCAQCAAAPDFCTHWVYAPNDAQHPACHLKDGAVDKSCILHETGSSAGILASPSPQPSPPPPNGPDKCVSEYGTDLYGQVAVEYIEDHAARFSNTSFFMYCAFQNQHTPYDAPPTSPAWLNTTYQQMMWAGDVEFGRIVQALKDTGMWDDTIFFYVSDNGGVEDGLNWPDRGEKHSNWEGGMHVTAFVGGGALPDHLRGTENNLLLHVADLYATISSLAGVDPADDPPVAPLPPRPEDPHFNIYGNNSFPPIDGVDMWPLLMSQTTNVSAAHSMLVASREVVYKGQYKLLVAQPRFKTQNNGWKQPNGTWEEPQELPPCAKQDLSPLTSYLPGIPGQLPCLFDLQADPSERHDIAQDNPALVQEMWAALNATVLTMRDCSGWSGPIKGPDGSCSPAALLGPCDESCADAHWYSVYGGEKHGQGPVCDVPTCN